MGDAFAGYDSWLERPYMDAAEEDENFYIWCEENDWDPENDPDALDAYATWMDSQYEEEYEYDHDFE